MKHMRGKSRSSTRSSSRPAADTDLARMEPLEARLLLSANLLDSLVAADDPGGLGAALISPASSSANEWEFTAEGDFGDGLSGILLGVPPPSTPSGPSTGVVGQTLTYSTKGTDPLKVHYYMFDWGDGSPLKWSSKSTQSHIYSAPGTYNIRAKEKCPLGLFETGWSNAKVVVITSAIPNEAAPVLDNTGDMSLNAIQEDDTKNSGTRVADIIASAGGDRITDADSGALEGIAVIYVNNTYGTWQYSINGGTTWLAFGTPSSSAARLLRDTDRIRFVPGAHFNGTLNNAIEFRAWDRTSGTAGGTANTTVNGGMTAFSSATETASITVLPANDRPTAAAQLTTTNEDVPKVITLAGSDVETPLDALIFIITTLPRNGTLDVPLGAIVGNQITYTPNPDYYGTDSFTFRVMDTGDPAGVGTSPALESKPATVTIRVNSVNDAPTLSTVNMLTGAVEDTDFRITYSMLLAASNAGDTDGGTLRFLIEEVTSGTLRKNGSVVVPGVTLLSPGESLVWRPPAEAHGGLDAFTMRAWDGAAASSTPVQVQVNVAAVPDVRIVASQPNAFETDPDGSGMGSFTISRDDGTGPLTVNFSVGGSARRNADYVLRLQGESSILTGNSVTFADGQTSLVIEVIPFDDRVAEPAKLVVIKLNSSRVYQRDPLVANRTATVCIADNEPTVSIVASQPNASETDPDGSGMGSFTISRDDGTGPLTVNFSVGGSARRNADYVLRLQGESSILTGNSVTFADGQTSLVIEVIPFDDRVAEPAKLVVIKLNSSRVYHRDPLVANRTATVYIADNEPTVSIVASQPNASETDPNGSGMGIFVITRDQSTEDLTVRFRVSGTARRNVDYFLRTEDSSIPLMVDFVTLAAGRDSLAIEVIPIDDLLIEPTKWVTLTVSSSSSYHLDPLLVNRTATVTILDDDSPGGP